MDDRTVDLIFAGSLETLPPVSSKIVRIFTSSTFTGKLYRRGLSLLGGSFELFCIVAVFFSYLIFFNAAQKTRRWREIR